MLKGLPPQAASLGPTCQGRRGSLHTEGVASQRLQHDLAQAGTLLQPGAPACSPPQLRTWPAICAWGPDWQVLLPQDADPTLTPEEKRVLERKLKKERKKEERKRLREAGQAAPAQRSGAELALDYLCG